MSKSKEQTEVTLNLHQRINKVMEDVNYIKKDKRNDFHRYNYASDEAIKKALHESFAKFGIVFLVNVESIQKEEIKTKKGDVSRITTVEICYSFTNVDNPEDKINGTFYGEGEDSLDKGIYKAITGAIKYILTSNFLIPTGDDPETDPKPPAPKPQAKPQAPVKPTLSAKQLDSAISRILGGEDGLLEKIEKTYNLDAVQKQKLNALKND